MSWKLDMLKKKKKGKEKKSKEATQKFKNPISPNLNKKKNNSKNF